MAFPMPPQLRNSFYLWRHSEIPDRSRLSDLAELWLSNDRHERPREILSKFFPALADGIINETRACHYTSTVSRNFVIDNHPDMDNVWIAGGGQAEAFKQGPVLGEYIAGRIMGTENDEELNASFRFPEEEFDEGEQDFDYDE